MNKILIEIDARIHSKHVVITCPDEWKLGFCARFEICLLERRIKYTKLISPKPGRPAEYLVNISKEDLISLFNTQFNPETFEIKYL